MTSQTQTVECKAIWLTLWNLPQQCFKYNKQVRKIFIYKLHNETKYQIQRNITSRIVWHVHEAQSYLYYMHFQHNRFMNL